MKKICYFFLAIISMYCCNSYALTISQFENQKIENMDMISYIISISQTKGINGLLKNGEELIEQAKQEKNIEKKEITAKLAFFYAFQALILTDTGFLNNKSEKYNRSYKIMNSSLRLLNIKEHDFDTMVKKTFEVYFAADAAEKGKLSNKNIDNETWKVCGSPVKQEILASKVRRLVIEDNNGETKVYFYLSRFDNPGDASCANIFDDGIDKGEFCFDVSKIETGNFKEIGIKSKKMNVIENCKILKQ